MDARPVLGMPALRPALLEHVSTARTREAESGRGGTRGNSVRSTTALRVTELYRCDDELEDEDVDDDDSAFYDDIDSNGNEDDEDEDEDDEDEEDEEDDEEPWQVGRGGRALNVRPA